MSQQPDATTPLCRNDALHVGTALCPWCDLAPRDLVLSLALRDEPNHDVILETSTRVIRYLATHRGSVAVCDTLSGSCYRLASSDGEWILTADNVPNASSCALNGTGPWVITPPLGLFLGFPLELLAPTTLPLDDPSRVPGGGKLTSILVKLALYGAHGCQPVTSAAPVTSLSAVRSGALRDGGRGEHR